MGEGTVDYCMLNVGNPLVDVQDETFQWESKSQVVIRQCLGPKVFFIPGYNRSRVESI